jgi:hypothetical protein
MLEGYTEILRDGVLKRVRPSIYVGRKKKETCSEPALRERGQSRRHHHRSKALKNLYLIIPVVVARRPLRGYSRCGKSGYAKVLTGAKISAAKPTAKPLKSAIYTRTIDKAKFRLLYNQEFTRATILVTLES